MENHTKIPRRIYVRPNRTVQLPVSITNQIGQNTRLLNFYQSSSDYFWLNYPSEEISKINGISIKLRFKLLLLKFWLEIGSEGRFTSKKPKQTSTDAALGLLQKYHKLNLFWGYRKFYLRKQLLRNQIIRKRLCFVCYKIARIRYFIIPITQRGPEEISNIIYLCRSCGWKINRN